MYNLPYFKAQDNKEVLEFMHKNPFIILCGCDENNKPVATQVPVLIEQRDDALYLLGHIMNNTDHHKAFIKNHNVLAIFNGPHTYVSASLYSNPQTGSTWNYITAHVKGLLSFLSKEKLLEILERTTARFENNENSPASFKRLPADYVKQLVPAISAFEIKVISIENVFKLSQNRNEESFENIIRHLSKQDEDAKTIAEEMMNIKQQIFH